MNGWMEVAHDEDVGADREVARVARPELAEPGFRNSGDGRATVNCPCVSLQNPSLAQASGLPGQLETEESQLHKTENFTTSHFTHADCHTCAVWGGLLQQRLERQRDRSASRPSKPQLPLQKPSVHLRGHVPPPSAGGGGEGKARRASGARG